MYENENAYENGKKIVVWTHDIKKFENILFVFLGILTRQLSFCQFLVLVGYPETQDIPNPIFNEKPIILLSPYHSNQLTW